MKKEDIQYFEAHALNEVIRRKHLGGYSADAEGNLILAELVFLILEHLRTQEDHKDKVKDSSIKMAGNIPTEFFGGKNPYKKSAKKTAKKNK